MKKIVAFVILTCCTLNVLAQRKPLKIGVKAGVTFPKINTSNEAIASDGGGISESKIYTSFYFGATVDVPISKAILFQPGFSVTGKGAKASYVYNLPNTATSGKIRLTYLEIPLNVLVNIPAGKGNVFVGLGPYVAYALAGTIKYTFTRSDEVYPNKQNINFGSDQDFKRLDVGGNALVGYKLVSGINIHADCSASAINISSSNDTYLKAKNLVYSIGVGFYL
ncbi:PorT family protein [Pedobacter frigidisoli]|uniref:PorT family protein n=1 Tax=Pedobacter frigidisoli TaxID=2530455 RepID=A0A4R0P3F2_9SPHI|nr:porin family protein [Pedobacter frigidisoli]TCD11109.1 PorT family protein [Pedobacter frigidisoli]